MSAFSSPTDMAAADIVKILSAARSSSFAIRASGPTATAAASLRSRRRSSIMQYQHAECYVNLVNGTTDEVGVPARPESGSDQDTTTSDGFASVRSGRRAGSSSGAAAPADQEGGREGEEEGGDDDEHHVFAMEAGDVQHLQHGRTPQLTRESFDTAQAEKHTDHLTSVLKRLSSTARGGDPASDAPSSAPPQLQSDVLQLLLRQSAAPAASPMAARQARRLSIACAANQPHVLSASSHQHELLQAADPSFKRRSSVASYAAPLQGQGPRCGRRTGQAKSGDSDVQHLTLVAPFSPQAHARVVGTQQKQQQQQQQQQALEDAYLSEPGATRPPAATPRGPMPRSFGSIASPSLPMASRLVRRSTSMSHPAGSSPPLEACDVEDASVGAGRVYPILPGAEHAVAHHSATHTLQARGPPSFRRKSRLVPCSSCTVSELELLEADDNGAAALAGAGHWSCGDPSSCAVTSLPGSPSGTTPSSPCKCSDQTSAANSPTRPVSRAVSSVVVSSTSSAMTDDTALLATSSSPASPVTERSAGRLPQLRPPKIPACPVSRQSSGAGGETVSHAHKATASASASFAAHSTAQLLSGSGRLAKDSWNDPDRSMADMMGGAMQELAKRFKRIKLFPRQAQ